MLSMEELGYFLYMEECEREEEQKKERELAAVGKYKEDSEGLLVAEWGTHNEN